MVINSIKNERLGVIDEFRGECQTNRSQQSLMEMAQVQAEKEQLQK